MAPTPQQVMQAEIERLQAENAALKARAAKPNKLSYKVSEKGALSVYGLGRFPVTLYKEQWFRLTAVMDDIREFLAAHDAELSNKGDAAAPADTSEKPAA